MNKILILGGGGMLGHKAYQVMKNSFDTYVTFRNFENRLIATNIFDQSKVFNSVDVFNYTSVENVITSVKPDYVINCIGVIKQLKEANDAKHTIYINSLFPHLLAESCKENNCRLIQISTDCVFSGKKGNYKEDDFADAYDLYGRTKYLGEAHYENSLTIRTSIIGHELFSNLSLIDWFISNKNKEVKGFKNAVYSGFPTIVLSNEIIRIIKYYPKLNGLYQISSNNISKHNLLNLVNRIYALNINIVPVEDFRSDKSLDCEKYIKKTNYIRPSWEDMINTMHSDYLCNNYKEYENV